MAPQSRTPFDYIQCSCQYQELPANGAGNDDQRRFSDPLRPAW